MSFAKFSSLVLLSSMPFLFTACKENKKEQAPPDPIVVKKDKPSKNDDLTSKNAPIINITDTLAVKYSVIYIKDSAVNSIRLSQKLADIYGEKLGEFIRKNKLKTTGRPMAWFKSQKAPFFFEAGIPVDKKPAKLPKGILYKNIGGDSAVVAHYFGPKEETAIAYETLREWLKDRKRKSTSAPYEIYVTNPIDKDGKALDPYKVLTDIVFPHN